MNMHRTRTTKVNSPYLFPQKEVKQRKRVLRDVIKKSRLACIEKHKIK